MRRNIELEDPPPEMLRERSWQPEREFFDDEGPVLMLELPSEESSRRPSKCSMRSGSPGVKNIN